MKRVYMNSELCSVCKITSVSVSCSIHRHYITC